jgi:hypothetical protein
MPTDQIARLRDARGRDAFNYVVSTVQAVADNRSVADEAALLEQTDSSIDNLTGVLVPIYGAHGCISNVISDCGGCRAQCQAQGKKFCGCVAGAIIDGLLCVVSAVHVDIP